MPSKAGLDRVDPRSGFSESNRKVLRLPHVQDTLSPEFSKDWADAIDCNLADPVTLQALAAGTITPEEVTAIKTKIKGI